MFNYIRDLCCLVFNLNYRNIICRRSICYYIFYIASYSIADLFLEIIKAKINTPANKLAPGGAIRLMMGTNTTKPHNPYTTDGMLAIKPIKTRNTAAIAGCA